jgi:tetratricopeptide (TPR) repeat protein
MKKCLWLLLAVTWFGPVSGRAQNQLPPGTQLPSSSPQTAQNSGLDEAEARIEQEDFAAARPLVEKYLSEHPSDARALFDLGYLDQTSNRDDAAAQDYRRAIAADPKQFESRLALGLMLAQQNPKEALEQLQQATLLTPSIPNPAAQAQAFRALAELNRGSDPDAAKEDLISALRLSPETPHDLLLTAQIAEASGDDEAAEVAYRRLLDRKPEPGLTSDASAGLVQLLLKEKKYGDVEPFLRSSLQRDPDDATLTAQLATTLIAEGKNSQALPVLEKLRRLEPQNSSVDQMLADAYSDAGYAEKADPIYAKIVQARPEDPAVLLAQGKNLMREQQYPQAEQVFQHALKIQPDNGDAWSGLAFAAAQNKQYSMTLQALSMRAKYLPETSASYFLWATSYDNLHQPRFAADYYRKFLNASGGKFPDQEWQAKQRLAILDRNR